MIKVKKLVSLVLGGVMSLGILSGCSSNSVDLYKAFSKSQNITSMRSKTDIKVSVSAENQSAKEKEVTEAIFPMINASNISITTATRGNKNKNKSQAEINMRMNLGDMPLDMAVWVDSDLTGKEPTIKEIIKLPSIFTAQAPEEFQGKEYMVMDLKDLTSVSGVEQPDFREMAKLSEELQHKLAKFMSKYALQYNPDMKLITKKDSQIIVQPGKTQSAEIYEIKLTDKTFKELLKYTATNFAESEDAMEFIEECIMSSLSFSGLSDEELDDLEDEMDNFFDEYEENLPQFIEMIDSAFEKIEDVKILGEEGISIQYAVSKEGYIINQKGIVDFVVDLANINKLTESGTSSEAPELTGVYNIKIEFNTDIYDINRYVHIRFPEVNEDNSFDYLELLGMVPAQGLEN